MYVMIDDVCDFFMVYGELFNEVGWCYVVEYYDGYLLVRICVVLEGLIVLVNNVLMMVECDDL